MMAQDVAVIGAGVFGAWTAWHLRRGGASVALVDAWGPGHSRASSGGESRIIRTGYGADEIYTRMAMRSLKLWKELGRGLFQSVGARARLEVADEVRGSGRYRPGQQEDHGQQPRPSLLHGPPSDVDTSSAHPGDRKLAALGAKNR